MEKAFESSQMEKAKQFLELTKEESDRVSRVIIPPQRASSHRSFYEDFAISGIRVDGADSNSFYCSFKVPPRLTDRDGNLAVGAIANLIDELGGALIYDKDQPMNVSVDMSISYLSNAKLNDELEIISKVLGQRGGYTGTLVLLRNKSTGEIVAEGQHSLFSRRTSKI